MKKPKFNLMDILIIVVIVAAIAGALTFFGSADPKAEKKVVGVEYEIQLVEREKVIADKFMEAKRKGQKLIVGVSDEVGAEIVDVKIEPARRHSTDQVNKVATYYEVPGLYDITFKLRSLGFETIDEVYTGDTATLRVGDGRSVRAKGVAGYGYVLSVNPFEVTEKEIEEFESKGLR